MRKTLMSVAIVGVIGLLVMPGLGCGKQEVVETDVVADYAGDAVEVVTEEPEAEVKKVEDADWKSMKQDSKAAKIDETAEEALLTLFAENPKANRAYGDGENNEAQSLCHSVFESVIHKVIILRILLIA